ncbi:MAG TPA: GNAT family N-acetyltransferase [Spirochaetes bacterium]|nr:GNAT family N-acetyltransferase [Spirochaetota bacterium]
MKKIMVPGIGVEALGDGMIMRGVRDDKDISTFAAFHGSGSNKVYGRMSSEWCRVWRMTCENLMRHHPEVLRDEFVIVEDERTGEIVSTTCLLPWHCQYEGVSLDAAMLEEVGTRPEYRHRGFIRAQMDRFHRNVADRRFDFSIIWGIPYFYRQYGYTYALDMQTADTIPAWEIPDAGKSEKSPYRIRDAVEDDAGVLAQLYQRSRSSLQLYDIRSLDYWQFLLKWMKYPARLIIDTRTGESVGYFCVEKLEEKEGIKVYESAIFDNDAGMFVLRHLKSEFGNEIQVGWPQTGELVRLARSLGSTSLPVYQWLLRVPDVEGLIRKIAPALERRIEISVFNGMTRDLCVNLYKKAFMLRFRHGKLENVDAADFVDSSIGAEGGDINIPPDAFIRLVFGYRKIDQLLDAWPDITVKPESRYIVEVLFPLMKSYFVMPWQYYGPVDL